MSRIQKDKFLIILVILFTVGGAFIGALTPIFVGRLIDEAIPMGNPDLIIIYAVFIVITLSVVELFTSDAL